MVSTGRGSIGVGFSFVNLGEVCSGGSELSNTGSSKGLLFSRGFLFCDGTGRREFLMGVS